MKWCFVQLTFYCLMMVMPSHAQVDISTELLLKKKSANSPKDSGLQSGRYQARPSKSKANTNSAASQDSDEMTIVLKPAAKLPKKKVSNSESKATVDPVVQMVFALPETQVETKNETKAESKKDLRPLLPVKNEAPAVGGPSPPETTVAPAPLPEEPADILPPPVLEQVKSVFTGEPPEQIAEYIERVHPDDQRLNRIEATAYTGILTNESKSSYSYRGYSVSSPFMGFDGRLFLNPFLGIKAGYSMTLAGDVDGGPTAGSRLAAKHEQSELAIDLRRYFGLSRRAKSIEYGVHYFNHSFSVSGDNISRVGLRSSGLGFHFMSRFPVTPGFTWILGGKLAPRFNHQESVTGIALSSGEAQESSRFGVIVGGEFKFSRSNIFECKLSWTMDKHVYSGVASHPDQNTGQIPSGVGVINNYGVLSLGYRWGQ